MDSSNGNESRAVKNILTIPLRRIFDYALPNSTPCRSFGDGSFQNIVKRIILYMYTDTMLEVKQTIL